MSNSLFTQLAFVRQSTLKLFEGLDEGMADIVPQGFNNNIRWNFGHIYTGQEKMVFQLAREQPLLPDGYAEMFSNGTKPADWQSTPPSLNELHSALAEQTARIEAAFANRLDEKIAAPYTTSAGLTMNTIQELILFTLYHEGMHFTAIRFYKRLLA